MCWFLYNARKPFCFELPSFSKIAYNLKNELLSCQEYNNHSYLFELTEIAKLYIIYEILLPDILIFGSSCLYEVHFLVKWEGITFTLSLLFEYLTTFLHILKKSIVGSDYQNNAFLTTLAGVM